MYILQRVYSLILNPISLVTSKINEMIRNAIILLCCTFIAGFFLAYFDKANKELLYRQHGQNNLICGAALLILIIISIKAPLRRVKWDKYIFSLMMLAGLGLVVIGFIHPIGEGYQSFGFMLMFLFPCLYYVWNNRGDYDVLYKSLALATSIVGFYFYFRVIILALSGELSELNFRVKAFLYNANMFSMIGMVMICVSLYMFLVNRGSRSWFILSALSFAIGWDIVRMGVSRLSILVGAGAMLAFAIFWLKTRDTFTSANTLKSQAIRLAVVVLFTLLFFYVGEALLNINTAVVYRQNNEVSAEQGDTGSDDAVENSDGEQEEEPEIPEVELENQKESATDRFSTDGKDLNTYTAGRIDIWKRYAAHLNMLGNNLDETDFRELTGCGVRHAHNNFLEYAYRCGIPVAIIHTLFELYAGIICLMFLFSKKYKEPYHLFAVVFMVCYAVESLFDIATVPFERHAPFFFYMLLIPVFGRIHDSEREAKKRRKTDTDKLTSTGEYR